MWHGSMGVFRSILAFFILGGGLGALAQDVPLDGVVNLRPIASYPTSDGRMIRPHLLFRSGELAEMTPQSASKLKSLGIKTEIDLRGPNERSKKPSKWGSWKPLTYAPVSDLKVTPNESDQDVYNDIAFKHAADFGAALRDLSRSKGPVLIHCAAGNDRTGVTVAILMTLLGVPHDHVDEEYLLSNAYWTRKEGKAPLYRKLLDDTFDVMTARYGSFDAYVANGLKLSKRDIAALRQNLTEERPATPTQ